MEPCLITPAIEAKYGTIISDDTRFSGSRKISDMHKLEIVFVENTAEMGQSTTGDITTETSTTTSLEIVQTSPTSTERASTVPTMTLCTLSSSTEEASTESSEPMTEITTSSAQSTIVTDLSSTAEESTLESTSPVSTSVSSASGSTPTNTALEMTEPSTVSTDLSSEPSATQPTLSTELESESTLTTESPTTSEESTLGSTSPASAIDTTQGSTTMSTVEDTVKTSTVSTEQSSSQSTAESEVTIELNSSTVEMTAESTEVRSTDAIIPATTSTPLTEKKTTSKVTTTARPTTTMKAPALCKSCLALGSEQYSPDQTFEADVGVTKMFPCPAQFEGNITSTCLRSNGVCAFQPRLPDYSNCSSAWLGDLENLPSSDAFDVIGENVADGSYTGQEITSILDLVKKTVHKQTEETVNKPPEERIEIQQIATGNAGDIINNLVKESRTWGQLDYQKRVETSTQIFTAIESVAFTLANLTEETGNCVNYTYNSNEQGSNVKFRCYAINEENLESEVIYRPQASVEITVSGNGPPGFKCVKMVGFFLTATNLDELYPVNTTDKEHGNVYLTNTDVLGFSFPPGQSVFESLSVVTVFKNKHVPTYPKQPVIHNEGTGLSTVVIGSQKCVYWDTNIKTWSFGGCELDVKRTTSTQTACNCNHLTPFGSIMATHKYQDWPAELDVVTTVSESLSVFALFLNFIVHGIVRSYHGEGRGNSERAVIILQISFWLGLSHVIILLFMNKSQFHLSEEACIVVAVLLHFSLLASFGWMLNEGMLLYRLITFVFRTNRSHKLYSILIGYGIPTVVVGVTFITAAVQGGIRDAYSNAAQCWLNIESGYIWAFNLPVILICTANLVVFVLVVRTRMKTTIATVERKKQPTQTWSSIIGFLALIFLMGLTWAFGMFTLIPAIWPLYVFGILNGFQGVFIFLFHCILDPRIMNGVKQVFVRHWKPRLTAGIVVATPGGTPTRRRSSYGLDLSSTEFASSVNMNVIRPARIFKRVSINISLDRSNFTWVDE